MLANVKGIDGTSRLGNSAISVSGATNGAAALCEDLKPLLRLVGIVLLATIVGIVMRLIGGSQYKLCTTCLNDPFGCPVISEMQYD